MKLQELVETEDADNWYDWSIDDYTPYGTYQLVKELISNIISAIFKNQVQLKLYCIYRH